MQARQIITDQNIIQNLGIRWDDGQERGECVSHRITHGALTYFQATS